MKTYIALLRGINVSGQKLIKMADLRVSLEKAGFKGAKTYIQSGNIILQSAEEDPKVIEEQVKSLILKDFGFDVPTFVTTAEYLEDTVKNNPFPEAEMKKIYVSLLDEKPEQERVDALNAADFSPEEFVIDDMRVYLFAALGAAKSKLSNNYFESKLKVKATSRNWNTINKLIALASQP